ncbi:MAG: DUF72 domain-containing protein [Pseudomonadota bacterium]
MSSAQLGFSLDDGPVVAAPAEGRFDHLAALPAGVFLGTSSWAFPGWQGLLYDRDWPAKVLSRQGLAAHAAQPWLRSASIDRAFYGPLAAAEYRHYASQVGPDFRFVVKTWQALTEPRTEGQRNRNFLSPAQVQTRVINPALEGAGDRIGQLLVQFSPGACRLFERHRVLFDERLATLLRGIDTGPAQVVVEVRSPRLFDENFLALLREHEAIPCLTVHSAMAPLATQWALVRRSEPPALSLRWNLGHGRGYEAAKRDYAPFNRLVAEDQDTRAVVVDAIRFALDAGIPATVIANNKAEGCAPLTLARVAEALLEHEEN